jgi:transposase-like protein
MKAHHIVFQKGAIARLDDTTYTVQSQSGHGAYVVVSTPSGFKCNCPDATYRGVMCKHALALEISWELRREAEQARQTVIPEVKITSCRYCKSTEIVRDGVRHTKKSGDIQKYNCKTCDRYFTVNVGFEKMHATPQIITSAMQLYFSGESFRNVQKFLRLQGIEITHQTVYNWTQKYVSLMQSYLAKITPAVSNTWRTDELFLKVKGDTKYLYAIMDDQTRFIIAQQVADSKYTQDVRPLFKEAKNIAGKKPTTLISDGARNFHQAYLKEYRNLARETQHIRHIHMAGDHHNNKMERLNGEYRDREKTMRNVKRMDTPVLKGYQLYHNFMREHQGLAGKTPAEIAGIKIEGQNKWITVIQNASKPAN